MLLQKKSGDGQEFLSRKKLSRKKLSIFVSKVGPATGVGNTPNRGKTQREGTPKPMDLSSQTVGRTNRGTKKNVPPKRGNTKTNGPANTKLTETTKKIKTTFPMNMHSATPIRRSPRTCTVKPLLLHLKQFSCKTNHHERSENLPFSRNLVTAERKRRAQGGAMWTEDNQKSDANHMA